MKFRRIVNSKRSPQTRLPSWYPSWLMVLIFQWYIALDPHYWWFDDEMVNIMRKQFKAHRIESYFHYLMKPHNQLFWTKLQRLMLMKLFIIQWWSKFCKSTSPAFNYDEIRWVKHRNAGTLKLFFWHVGEVIFLSDSSRMNRQSLAPDSSRSH